MNPAQQQVVAQYNQFLQQVGGQMQQLLQQAQAGAQQMIQQNPTDMMPLSNALTAIEQQYKQVARKPDDAFSDHYDRLCNAGPGEPGHATMKRAMRGFGRWADETWMRFDTYCRVEQFRAMWPHVQQAGQKQLPCSRCG